MSTTNKPRPVKVRTIIEVDQAVLKEIESIRGDASLPVMLGLVAKVGLGTLQNLARNHINPFKKGDSA